LPPTLVDHVTVNLQTLSANGPSMEFVALRRLKKQAATNTGLTSPGCATPSGFLNLMTLYSACNRPALFHAGNALELQPSEDFPSQ
jgi:hypothetical protein